MERNDNILTVCSLCPRRCGAERYAGMTGFCGVSDGIKVARAALHYWEEPCISGENGSGTVFFSGCALKCVFCQNREISRGEAGKIISGERLADIFIELQGKRAHNINLVTPDHYCLEIGKALTMAKDMGLHIPVVANTGGYLSEEQYGIMKTYTDIWLTDLKYHDSALSLRYSKAADYPYVARAALDMMVKDTGAPVYDRDGIMKSGVIVRILLLPGCVEDAKRSVKYLYDNYGDDVVISLMNQYTPPSEGLPDYPEIMRTVTEEEYGELVDYAVDIGVENAFTQEGGTQEESFIPPFDLEGV